MHFYKERVLLKKEFDVIIIGSGIGGLAAASVITQCSNRSVLVLEQHYTPGGLTHSFGRRGYQFDVGLHYVGKMAGKFLEKKFFDYLCGYRIQWKPLPYFFEKFSYPDFKFRVPSEKKRYRASLIEQFPEEKRAIKKFFRDMQRASLAIQVRFAKNVSPILFHPFLRLLQNKKLLDLPTKDYLDKHFSSVKLKSVLTSQWGDIGLLPQDSSFGIIAVVMEHYLYGGYFPENGSPSVIDAFEKTIENHGGHILVNSKVNEIITRNGRVEGVEVLHSPGNQTVLYKAPVVISDAGAYQTFKHLVKTPEVADIQRSLSNLPMGYSAVTLYLGLKDSPEVLGEEGGNTWVFKQYGHPDLVEQSRNLIGGNPSTFFISFPSLRVSDEVAHTAQIIAFVDPSAFKSWAKKEWNNRGKEYEDLKEIISMGLLDAAEKELPGLKDLVDYRELSTPLSIEYFSERSDGVMYGIPAIPGHWNRKWLRIKTPIKGLLLGGSDVLSMGVIGSMMGGAGAGAVALGPAGFLKLLMKVYLKRKRPLKSLLIKDSTVDYMINEKVEAELIYKKKLTESIYEMSFELPLKVNTQPGQFLRVMLPQGDWRDYSIYHTEEGKSVSLLVDTKNMGKGSVTLLNLKEGESLTMRLPLGDFHITHDSSRKLFVSTGTGIAPLIPMIKECLERDEKIDLLFGCRGSGDYFLEKISYPLPVSDKINLLKCYSREENESAFHGRVTDYLEKSDLANRNISVYVSGGGDMIDDVKDLLEKKLVKNIYSERY